MRRRPSQPGLIAVVLAGAIPGVARAQAVDEGPVVVGERTERLRFFILDRFDASLDFYSRYRRDKRETEGTPTRTDTELLFRESVGVSSRFFLGHPNLADVNASASIGIEDNFIDSDSLDLSNEHETSLFTQYDVTALILGEGPAPLTLFARRYESLLERAFIGSVESTTTEFGASVRMFLDTAPTTLTYTHRIEDQDDDFGFNDSTLTQDTFSIQSLWNPNQRHQFSFDYVLDLVDESRALGFDTNYTRHDASLVHQYRFGSDEQHDLRSNLRVFHQEGDFEQTLVRLLETLTLRHSDTFDSRYDLTLENRDIRGQAQQVYRGLITLRHRLFDSLVTTGTLGASRFELSDEDFTSDEFRAGINFEYVKQVPYGRLDASMGLNLTHQEDSSRGRELVFLDSPRTFPDAAPITITGNTILPDSIVVTDSTGTRRYIEDVDYRLRAFGDRVELQRLIGGLIAENETVLIDYTLGPDVATTVDTFAFVLAGRYTIEEGFLTGLAPYFDFRDISQSISPSSATRTPFDVTSIRAGADYRVGRFTFNGEYEHQDSSVAPFDALRASARYEHRLGLNSFLRLDYIREMIDFEDSGGSIDLDRVLAEYGHRFSNGLEVRVRGLYRNERDSLAGDTEGFEQSLELDWQIRQTTLNASIRNAMLESANEKTESQTFAFGLRRLF